MLFGPHFERPFGGDDDGSDIHGACLIGAPDQRSIDTDPVDLGSDLPIDLDRQPGWNADPCIDGGRLALCPGRCGAPIARLHGDMGLRAQGHQVQCRRMLAMARQILHVTRGMFRRLRVASAMQLRQVMRLVSIEGDQIGRPKDCGQCRNKHQRNR
nr:hypothetical protein [Bradyrhizobium macuxiense]